MNMASQKKIPVTVITGFLGSGKTTLINRILSEDHGVRFAVIENEFGEVGIDQDLVIREKEEVIEMNNGCICCTVRGDLVRIITKLIQSERPPEHILIETTGLADPSPVAQTFLTDPFIAEHTSLDGIVTLVDARHIRDQLKNTPEAKDQIAFADIILLNKVDLVSKEERMALEKRIREINRFAILHYTVKGDIDLKKLFNVGGFNIERALSINPKFMEIEYPFEYGCFYQLSAGTYTLTASPNGEEKSMKIILTRAPHEISQESLNMIANPTAILFSCPPISRRPDEALNVGQDTQKLLILKANSTFILSVPKDATYALFTEHLPHEFELTLKNASAVIIEPVVSKEFRAAHTHDESVSSVGIEIEGELDPKSFMYFIQGVISTFGNDLYRYKGIFAVKGELEKIVLQGVHMLFEMQPNIRWKENEPRKSSIIFIGRNLNRNILTQGFISCVVREKSS